MATGNITLITPITGWLETVTGYQYCNRLVCKHYRLWYARASHDNRDCSLASHETGHHPLYLTGLLASVWTRSQESGAESNRAATVGNRLCWITGNKLGNE